MLTFDKVGNIFIALKNTLTAANNNSGYSFALNLNDFDMVVALLFKIAYAV